MADKIRTLVVDDEQPARERLIQLLSPFREVEIVGEAEDGEQALERILELRPDLVFLDIQMPGCSGMEVAASLPSPRPKLIFCTAYDEYAVDAFEVHAVDYLLKPVNRTRLEKALERVREPSPSGADSTVERALRAAGGFPSRFLGKRGNRYRVVPSRQVLYFDTEGGLTRLHAGEHQYWVQPTLTDLESRLDPAGYFRVSRSAIVNLDAVAEVLPMPGGHGMVRMRNGSKLDVSRRRFKELMELLSKT